MKDTYNAFLDTVVPSRNPQFQAALKERQRILDEQAKSKGRKAGMGEIVEYVKENDAPAPAQAQDQAWLEDESRPNMARAADEARRQRVAAARERRSRPAGAQR